MGAKLAHIIYTGSSFREFNYKLHYLELDWTQFKNFETYPSIRDIESKILQKNVVGIYKSLRHIHCIRDINVQDIEV